MTSTYLDMNGMHKVPEEPATIATVPAEEETQYYTLGQKVKDKDTTYCDAKSDVVFHKDDVPMLPLRFSKKSEYQDYRTLNVPNNDVYNSPSISPSMWPEATEKPLRMILIALFVGIVLGSMTISIIWLTLDKLKDPTVIWIRNDENNQISEPQAQTGSDQNWTETDSQKGEGSQVQVPIGGTVYYRWGKNQCPQNSSLLYKGFTAGGRFSEPGSTTNTFCLPENPTWAKYNNVTDVKRNFLYGSEFEGDEGAWLGMNVENQDIPCSVCQANGRLSHLMIPASTECPLRWTLEYSGYLMGNKNTYDGSYESICVDSEPDFITGGGGDQNGKLLFFTEVNIDTLPSPPFYPGRELACVVCTQ